MSEVLTSAADECAALLAKRNLESEAQVEGAEQQLAQVETFLGDVATQRDMLMHQVSIKVDTQASD